MRDACGCFLSQQWKISYYIPGLGKLSRLSNILFSSFIYLTLYFNFSSVNLSSIAVMLLNYFNFLSLEVSCAFIILLRKASDARCKLSFIPLVVMKVCFNILSKYIYVHYFVKYISTLCINANSLS